MHTLYEARSPIIETTPDGYTYPRYDLSDLSDEQLSMLLDEQQHRVNFEKLSALETVLIDLRTALRAVRNDMPMGDAIKLFDQLMIQRLRDGDLVMQEVNASREKERYFAVNTSERVMRDYDHELLPQPPLNNLVYMPHLASFAIEQGRAILIPTLDPVKNVNGSTADIISQLVSQRIFVFDAVVCIYRRTTPEERAVNVHLPSERKVSDTVLTSWGSVQLAGYVPCHISKRYVRVEDTQQAWIDQRLVFIAKSVDLTDAYITTTSTTGNTPTKLPYSTDVLRHFGFGRTTHKIQGRPIYVGIELETAIPTNQYPIPVGNVRGQTYLDLLQSIDAPNKRRVTSWNMNRYKRFGAVPTQDGSLDSNGVEWIFKPEGIAEMRANVQKFVHAYGDQHEYDATEKSVGENSYGLHIHVSSVGTLKERITRIRIAAVMYQLSDFIFELGGRSNNGYCYKPKVVEINSLDDRRRRTNSLANRQDENNLWLLRRYGCDDITNYITNIFDSRYESLNLTKRETLEFRFPKSLVDEEHIMRNVEFAHAVTMFGAYEVMSIMQVDGNSPASMLREFTGYIMRNYKQYPSLAQYLVRRYIHTPDSLSVYGTDVLEYVPTKTPYCLERRAIAHA